LPVNVTTAMSENPANSTEQNQAAPEAAANRAYDRTGFYPSEGKKFRIWALLGWNVAIIVLIAVISAAINHWALG
jgi:hypothetical protein